MAGDNLDDPSEELWQRIMAQQQDTPEPMNPSAPADPGTPSPDFATAPAPIPLPAPGPDVISRNSLAAGSSLPQAGVDRSTGGVAQSQPGYAPVSGADLQVRQAPIDQTSFYNANTGAAAHYDPASGMYIDSNGQMIRPDAIRTSNPSQFSGQGGGTTGAGAPSAGAGITMPGNNAWRDSIRAIIMKRLALSQEPVDENDPAIRAALSGARDEATRASTTERNQLAERLYAQGGLNTDAITQGIQQSNERMGGALGTLRANILMGRYREKTQELNHLLDLATQTGDTEQAQQIQVALANLNAAVQRENMGLNLAEFTAQLNQNSALAGLRG